MVLPSKLHLEVKPYVVKICIVIFSSLGYLSLRVGLEIFLVNTTFSKIWYFIFLLLLENEHSKLY